ncbi:MAG: hypothetical protein IJW48_04920 [Clostridia bacterium]|nr:hypothetical protein [Clostridia bacterium]
MKRLTVVLFSDSLEYKQYVNYVCDKFSGPSEKSEFLGTWWIECNEEEVCYAISGAANHFIDDTDKTEIIFGIGNKDYDGIICKIHTENCKVVTVNCKNL